MNNIINRFESLLVEDKVEKISSIIKELGLSYMYEEGIGIIVNKQDKPNKVIFSHYDLIPLFSHAIIDNGALYKVNNETVEGALDNTITNAILIEALCDLNSEDLSGVEIVFTDMEEIGFIGAKNYIRKYIDRIKDSLFINLDVTNEGYGYSGAIEYDLWTDDLVEKIKSLDINFHYTKNRVGDDLCAVVYNNLHGFSYCLPTKNLIHSFKNRCRKESLVPYKEGLKSIIKMK